MKTGKWEKLINIKCLTKFQPGDRLNKLSPVIAPQDTQ